MARGYDIVGGARDPPTDEATGQDHRLSTNESDYQDSQSYIDFADCAVSFAIDTSGSTRERALKGEQQAVECICSQLNLPARLKSKVLPWNSRAEEPINISQLYRLVSYGGTVPWALMERLECRQAIESSTLWVLLTDGIISEPEIRQFATALASHGLHGKACITIITGSISEPPVTCNISVGLSVFATVPDCLFLYIDVHMGQTYILQCSGRFTEILELKGERNPVIDSHLRWSDLPRLSWQDLKCVSISPPKQLAPNEMALQNGLVINLDDLFAGKISDEAVIDQIFKNEANLQAIMLTAQTRGRAEDFQHWLEPYQQPVLTPKVTFEDENSQATVLIKSLLDSQKRDTYSLRTKELQTEIDELRRRHYNLYHEKYQKDLKVQSRRRRSSGAAMVRSRRPSNAADALTSLSYPSESESMSDDGKIARFPQRSKKNYNKVSNPKASAPEPLFNSSFLRTSRPEETFLGTCGICGQKKAALVLFLRKSPSMVMTPNFPAEDTRSRIAFPLAMGNFPETDILSTSQSCDFCSYYLAQQGYTPEEDEISCVLPLVCFTINAAAYEKQLARAFGNRFDKTDQLLVFVSVLITSLEKNSPVSELEQWRRSVVWLTRDLVQKIPVSPMSELGSTKSQYANLSPFMKALNTAFDPAHKDASGCEKLFKYPLEGFLTLVLCSEHMEGSAGLLHQRRFIAWQRFLFLLTESYLQTIASRGFEHSREALRELLRLNAQEAVVNKPDKFLKIRRRTSTDLFASIKTSVDLNTILSSSLFKEDDRRVVSKLLSKLGFASDWPGHATGIYLHYLANESIPETFSAPHVYFSKFRKSNSLVTIFLEPDRVDEQLSRSLIRKLPYLLTQPEMQKRLGTASTQS